LRALSLRYYQTGEKGRVHRHRSLGTVSCRFKKSNAFRRCIRNLQVVWVMSWVGRGRRISLEVEYCINSSEKDMLANLGLAIWETCCSRNLVKLEKMAGIPGFG